MDMDRLFIGIFCQQIDRGSSVELPLVGISSPIHMKQQAKTYRRQYAKLPHRSHRKAALHFLRPRPAPAEYPSAS